MYLMFGKVYFVFDFGVVYLDLYVCISAEEDGWASEGMRLRVPPVESQLPLGQKPG